MKTLTTLFTAYQDAACRLSRVLEGLDIERCDREIKIDLMKLRTAEYLMEKSYDLAVRGGSWLEPFRREVNAKTQFNPDHVLLLCSGVLPEPSSWDAEFWSRVNLIDFPYQFKGISEHKEKRHKMGMKMEKIQQMKNVLGLVFEEYSFHAEKGELLTEEQRSVMVQAARGYVECLTFEKDYPERNTDVDEGGNMDDYVGDFVGVCCELNDGGSIGVASLYRCFGEWFRSNVDGDSCGILRQASFGREIRSLDGVGRERIGGSWRYTGLSLKQGFLV